MSQIWVKSKGSETNLFLLELGAKEAVEKHHPISGVNPTATTDQLGQFRPWNEVLPHFKFEHAPSFGDELQTEYFIPLKHGYQALLDLNRIGDLINPLLLVTEIRTIAGDKAALSPAFGGAVLAIHFTWINNEIAVRLILPKIESILKQYNARPHPGKIFSSDQFIFPEIYPKFMDFERFRDSLDPKKKFINTQLKAWGF